MPRLPRLHPAAYRRSRPALSANRMNPLKRAGPLPLKPNPAPMRTAEGLRVGRRVSPMAFLRSRFPGIGGPSPATSIPQRPVQMPTQAAAPQNPYSPGSQLDTSIGGDVIARFREMLDALSGR
jgi:hypothetical protein